MKLEARSTGQLGSYEKKLRDGFSTKHGRRMSPTPSLLRRVFRLKRANAGSSQHVRNFIRRLPGA